LNNLVDDLKFRTSSIILVEKGENKSKERMNSPTRQKGKTCKLPLKIQQLLLQADAAQWKIDCHAN
jgi:hypothetical protein